MTIGIHQPHYFPWLGYFDKMAKSDKFIFLDDVQLEKGSFMYRNRIINERGNVTYLTISGEKHGFLNRRYREILSTNDEEWLTKHKDEIKRAYGESPYYFDIWNLIEELFELEEKTICAYCIRSTTKIKEILDIPTVVMKQSELQIDNTMKKNDLIIEICKAVGADCYLSGSGARKYTEESAYKESGINITYQEFVFPAYNQMHTAEFIPGLSILDTLFNCGVERTKEMFWAQINTK